MTKILLARHGHVDGIRPERFRGRQPLALTALGRAEAEALARRIAGSWKPAHIYTSPMERSLKTAEAIARACKLAGGEACDDLNDIDYGAWQFMTFEQAKTDDPALFAAWFATPHLVRFPGGESLQDLVARAAEALRLVCERHPAPAETVVLV